MAKSGWAIAGIVLVSIFLVGLIATIMYFSGMFQSTLGQDQALLSGSTQLVSQDYQSVTYSFNWKTGQGGTEGGCSVNPANTEVDIGRSLTLDKVADNFGTYRPKWVDGLVEGRKIISRDVAYSGGLATANPCSTNSSTSPVNYENTYVECIVSKTLGNPNGYTNVGDWGIFCNQGVDDRCVNSICSEPYSTRFKCLRGDSIQLDCKFNGKVIPKVDSYLYGYLEANSNIKIPLGNVECIDDNNCQPGNSCISGACQTIPSTPEPTPELTEILPEELPITSGTTDNGTTIELVQTTDENNNEIIELVDVASEDAPEEITINEEVYTTKTITTSTGEQKVIAVKKAEINWILISVIGVGSILLLFMIILVIMIIRKKMQYQ